MSEITYLTYYQRKKDVVLNKAKDYYKIKTKKENMGRIDIIICLKKRNKD